MPNNDTDAGKRIKPNLVYSTKFVLIWTQGGREQTQGFAEHEIDKVLALTRTLLTQDKKVEIVPV